MYQFEIQGDIESRVSSQTVCHLHRLWMRFHAAASGLPAYADLSPERLPWCAASLMVLVPDGDGDFLYRYYGPAIAEAARFDMTGKRVSAFRSDVGRFFREKYLRCLATSRPLYTVHRATHVATVHTWERLLLPVLDGDTPVVVALNQPMAFRHEFLQRVLESTTSTGILFAAAVHAHGDATQPVTDFQVLSANAAAARLLGRPSGSLGERHLSDVLPGLLGGRIHRLCLQAFESEAPVEARINDVHHGIERIVQVCGVRAGDGVTLVASEATRQEAQEAAYADLAQALAREREASLRLQSQLRAIADTRSRAGPPRRADLLAALEVDVEASVAAGSTLSLLLLYLETPGGSSDPAPEPDDDVLIAVLRLCQGMLRRRDWVCRSGPRSFAAILPGATDEAVHEMASRIVESVAIRFRSEPMLSARITVAAGLARWDGDEDARTLLRRAEIALGDARAAGRGGIRRADP